VVDCEVELAQPLDKWRGTCQYKNAHHLFHPPNAGVSVIPFFPLRRVVGMKHGINYDRSGVDSEMRNINWSLYGM